MELRLWCNLIAYYSGENANKSTPAEKGDAILKIFGASAAAFCGIWIDSMLEKLPVIPESLRGSISTLLSGLASMLVFYLLDKADVFNVKAEKRNTRIKELFDERINVFSKPQITWMK